MVGDNKLDTICVWQEMTQISRLKKLITLGDPHYHSFLVVTEKVPWCISRLVFYVRTYYILLKTCFPGNWSLINIFIRKIRHMNSSVQLLHKKNFGKKLIKVFYVIYFIAISSKIFMLKSIRVHVGEFSHEIIVNCPFSSSSTKKKTRKIS